MTILSVLLLASCAGGKSDNKIKEISVTLPNGNETEAYLITASNGEDYYVTFVDSVNYQQALELQYDGWVLPHMYGAYATDEHRCCTSIPTLEDLFGLSTPATDEDSANPDEIMLSFPNKLTTLMWKKDVKGIQKLKDNGTKGVSLWSGTRFPGKKGLRYNYTLTCFLEPDSTDGFYTMAKYGINAYDETKCAMLLKRAVLIDKLVPEDVYYVNDTLIIPSTRYTGADGFDYYVVQLHDSLYTWYEAINMERDGWMLPRSEGRYHGARGHEREVEYWRLHSEGLEATVEGLSGMHPFVNIEKMSRMFNKAFPQPCWTGTPRNAREAYMLGSKYHSWNGNLWEYDKEEKTGLTCLVKRVQPSRVRYYPKGSPLYVQPMKVTGASGKEYLVVDPLGWHGFGCREEEALSLEQPDWHIITFDEMGDMLGGTFTDDMLPLGYGMDMDHPLFHSLFPRTGGHNYYYARTTNGGEIQTIYMRKYTPHFSRNKVDSFFWDSSYVRLVYNGEP